MNSKKSRDKYDFDLQRSSFVPSVCLNEARAMAFEWTKTKHETTHATQINKRHALLYFGVSDMSCDKCSGISQNEKFTHTFHAYNNNNLYTFIRFFTAIHLLALWRGAPQTPIIIERFRFILLFIFSSILREHFMTSQQKRRLAEWTEMPRRVYTL